MSDQLDLLTPDFDGQTYDRPLDHARLSTTLARVYRALADGRPWTLAAKTQVSAALPKRRDRGRPDCRRSMDLPNAAARTIHLKRK
jgi:hypothetical protein